MAVILAADVLPIWIAGAALALSVVVFGASRRDRAAQRAQHVDERLVACEEARSELMGQVNHLHGVVGEQGHQLDQLRKLVMLETVPAPLLAALAATAERLGDRIIEEFRKERT